jgi:ribonuclease HI
MSKKRQKWSIYTDGGCIGNPGPGGYGVVLISGKDRHELSGGFRMTTNNRMELVAAIKGLGELEGSCVVDLYSDSRYLVDGIVKGWAKSWRANRWRKANKRKAQNADLWRVLLDLCDRHSVKFTWVRGHSGNWENERCDYLSFRAAKRKKLQPDRGYENSQIKPLSLFDD